MTDLRNSCLSVWPEMFNQVSKGLCTNFLEWELLLAWLIPSAWTGYTRENVFPPENRKAEVLMENAAIWLRSCPSMSWKWDNPTTFCYQPSVVSFFPSFPCPQCSALLPVPALCYRISPGNSTEVTFLQHKAKEIIWGTLCTCNSGRALETRLLIKRSKPLPETNV